MTEPAAADTARERILAAAVRQIAGEGIDGVRIARIAIEARVSPALVHYHFATREALLAEALDYSYALAADARLDRSPPAGATHAQRLAAMVEQCLPTTPTLTEDWVLWVELWLRAVRHPQLRPFAEELYARMRSWFADEIAAGVAAGEFERCDPDEVADRTLALLDGFGVRTLIGDSSMTLERARRAVSASLARDLGLGERLSASSSAPARRAIQTPPPGLDRAGGALDSRARQA
ncbi:MAG: TetR/AcrR family transcriptional regulator [Solirubrobacteraceae bacterium]